MYNQMLPLPLLTYIGRKVHMTKGAGVKYVARLAHQANSCLALLFMDIVAK